MTKLGVLTCPQRNQTMFEDEAKRLLAVTPQKKSEHITNTDQAV